MKRLTLVLLMLTLAACAAPPGPGGGVRQGTGTIDGGCRARAMASGLNPDVCEEAS